MLNLFNAFVIYNSGSFVARKKYFEARTKAKICSFDRIFGTGELRTFFKINYIFYGPWFLMSFFLLPQEILLYEM